MSIDTLPAFIRHAQLDRDALLARHALPDGSTDIPGLIAAAVRVRRQVQSTEAEVNAGEVCNTTRERCAILQGRDIVHRRLLSELVAGWDEAVAQAHKDSPQALKAKAMQRAAQKLGLWEVKL